MKRSLVLVIIGLFFVAFGLAYTEWQAQKIPPRPTLSPAEIRLHELEGKIQELKDLENQLDLPELSFAKP